MTNLLENQKRAWEPTKTMSTIPEMSLSPRPEASAPTRTATLRTLRPAQTPRRVAVPSTPTWSRRVPPRRTFQIVPDSSPRRAQSPPWNSLVNVVSLIVEETRRKRERTKTIPGRNDFRKERQRRPQRRRRRRRRRSLMVTSCFPVCQRKIL